MVESQFASHLASSHHVALEARIVRDRHLGDAVVFTLARSGGELLRAHLAWCAAEAGAFQIDSCSVGTRVDAAAVRSVCSGLRGGGYLVRTSPDLAELLGEVSE